ncbi:MAG: hypothetical protein K6E71_05090 [Lachnospiraceae bacterium]|nr:hypothetical protein [Lachnospiraceae bacterium]
MKKVVNAVSESEIYEEIRDLITKTINEIRADWPKDMWAEVFLSEFSIASTRIGMIETYETVQTRLKQSRILMAQIENMETYAEPNITDGERKHSFVRNLRRIKVMLRRIMQRTERQLQAT